MNTPEGRVKNDIKKALAARGVWYYMPVQNGMGVVGIPDFVCCWQGRFLGIEAKAPGKRGTATPNQLRVLALIREHGGLAIVADDAAQVVELLEGNCSASFSKAKEVGARGE